MDEQINSYIESLVLEVLESPGFVNLSLGEKQAKGELIRDHISNVVLDTVVDSLTEEQLKVLEKIPHETPEMEHKIEEYSSQIPSFSTKLEEALRVAIDKVKLNPQLLTQEE